MMTVLFVRNGQVHEAWEGGDGPGWTLRRPQSRHREGASSQFVGVTDSQHPAGWYHQPGASKHL